AREELVRGLRSLLGIAVTVEPTNRGDGAVVAGTPATSPDIARLGPTSWFTDAGGEGFFIYLGVRYTEGPSRRPRNSGVFIGANSDIGVLYGVFHLLRQLENLRPVEALPVVEHPRIGL